MPFEWLTYARVIAVILGLAAVFGLWRIFRSKARLWRRLLGGVALVALVAASAGTLIVSRVLDSNIGGPAVYRGKQVPAFPFRLVNDDASRDLAETRGKVVLINFWATW